MAPQRKWARIVIIAVLLAALLLGVLYRVVLPGLSVARRQPAAVETAVATWLLRHSVPWDAKRATSPIGLDTADVTAGKDLFAQKCASCHAYDGSGKTEIGAGTFPRPPVLRDLVASLTDGEIFYNIRNGIRNTAMPAWSMPDREVWQLVAYLRHLPTVATLPAETQSGPSPTARYTGSAACKSCHQDIYERWSKTRMANAVRDPKVHPDAIIPDFSQPNPLVTFTRNDIAFVYGSGWKQRYFRKVGDDYYPYPAQWDVNNKKWLPYHVPSAGGDWWAPFYPDPGDNSARPTGPLCDGCHSVNYDITTHVPTEWNVGCERCHGAGSEHVAHPVRDNILNPSRMDYVHANDTCIQCHSQGRPLKNPIAGKYYDWPVGFHVGLDLSAYWKLEEHKLGETGFTHFADGTAHKNRMQGNDFVQSLMYARGVTCFSCHDPHGSANQASLREPPKDICLSCHGPNTQNGPHDVSIEAHTHHPVGSPGDQCVACHMPAIEQTIANINVSAHTFRFITPSQSDALRIPNACNLCHADKTTAWATDALNGWKNRSPWRTQQ